MLSWKHVSRAFFDMRTGLTVSISEAAEDIVLGAEELRYAAQAVGKISGLIDVEDILDVVFRDFCIGK